MQTPRQSWARKFAVGAAALWTAACGSVQTGQGPSQAPQFELPASDGQIHSLQSLTAKGTVFFYAIKDGCPVNAKAEEFFDELAQAYAGKVTFVGVSNLTAKTYPAWREKFEPSYTVLFDPKREVIRGLGAKRSPWLIEVDGKGAIVKSWKGYSEADLGDMSSAMAAAAGVQPAQLDFTLAPEATSYG